MNEEIIKTIMKHDDININVSKDNIYIIESWDDVNKIEAIANNYNDIPLFLADKQINPDKYISIDNIFDEWGFSDSYLICDHCNNSICLNTYDKPYYHIFKDGFIMCGNCIREDKAFSNQYIDELINNYKRANTILTDNNLENIGFIKCNCKDSECDFSAGLREGYQDKPNQILNNAIKKNPDMDYLFDVTCLDMFETRFTIYRRSKDYE